MFLTAFGMSLVMYPGMLTANYQIYGDFTIKREDKVPAREERSSGGKCPFIKEPLEGCYCTLLTSINVEKTLYYCNLHYGECKIYKKFIKGK